jgi:mono/diheme cytochrome c family protein
MTQPKFLVALFLLLCLSSQAATSRATEPVDDRIDFQRQIQPILAEHCLQCHGIDADSRQAGLRLDDAKYATVGGDSGQAAITPGNPNASLILSRIASTDPDEAMPPAHINKPISPSQLALLKKWIEQGARYESHWAFTPPVKKPLPTPDGNPIDAFVRHRLAAAGAQPAPPAPKNVLARRIYLDAIGIPPTPEQLTTLANGSIESTIDQLLASEMYGEKWARHWLDVARYSDTNGYEKDLRRDQWAWRDWVVAAINRDMPYDQFMMEQIAGDLLPNATQDQIIATGFLRNSMINEEGAIVPEQFRMVEMFDRIDCLGKAALGLTTQCAQCHTHKFDPITHEEYYGMFAFLNNSYEAQSAVYTQEQLQSIQSVHTAISAIENKIRQDNMQWESDLNAWSKSIVESQPDWKVVSFDDMNSVSGLNHPVMQKDGAILMTGHSSSDVYMISSPELTGVTGLRLEVLNHGDLPLRGPGRNANGMWQLQAIDVFIKKPDSNDWEKQKISNVTADFSSPETKDAEGKNSFGPVAFINDGKPETAWTSDRGMGRRNQASVAVMAFEQPLNAPAGSRFKITMNMGDNIGCCRFSLCTTPQPVAPSCDQAVVLALQNPPEQRKSSEQSTLFTGWRKSRAELAEVNKQIDAQFDRLPQPYSTVLHLMEREDKLARPTHLLDRGEWDRPKQPIAPRVPAALHPLVATNEHPRLAFAKWLVDKRSPLAARVQVNRIWQAIFGEGLVETSEDFGTRTSVPEQVDLLDYLAVDFMEHGWSQKYLVKLILMSQTYQQSSAIRPELMERDPKNRLLWRGPRFRAEAELVRDIALAASGLLHQKLGGPSVIPPVPQNVLNYNYIVPTFWTPATGPERYRRALYLFRKRSMPDPVMSSFDSPNGDFACARRVRSNTPLAALTGLNETIFVEAAQAMALRILREAGKDEEARINRAYMLCMSRAPKEQERAAIRELLSQQRQRLADGWLNPREIATGDAAKLPELPAGASPQDAAAWTIVSRVLLNLDETISKN